MATARPAKAAAKTAKATKASARPAARGRRGSAEAASAVAGLVQDLAEIAELAPKLATSALAGSAMALAKAIDDPGTSATSKSMCARALIETLDRLRELAPEPEQKDGLDALTATRETRLSRRPKA